MQYEIPIIAAFLCFVSLWLFIGEKDNAADEPDDSTAEQEQAIYHNRFPGMWIYSIIMICLTVGIAVLFCYLYQDNDIFTSLKCVGLLAIIWPVAYVDMKEYRIPNAFIILGLVYRAVLIPLELIFTGSSMRFDLLSEVIAAAALLLAAAMCSICMKNSIGYGDMKLFVVMGLLLGLDGIWGAVFLSLVISFFVSVYVLVTRKKKRTDVIPFGPAIVIGTFLSVALSGV